MAAMYGYLSMALLIAYTYSIKNGVTWLTLDYLGKGCVFQDLGRITKNFLWQQQAGYKNLSTQ